MKVDSADMDIEAPKPPLRTLTRDGKHWAMDETTMKAGGCCGGVICLGAFIGLIILLCSIHTLGPEEQVVIEGGEGKYVRNGPQKVILSPSRKKTFREATRLGPRQYAVVKHSRQGTIRHEVGPKLLWLEAYDELVGIRDTIVLQLQEYTRLVDSMTGSEKVVSGPDTIVPAPLEQAVNGTEQAIVLSTDMTVLTMNKTTGRKILVTKEGVFIPQAYQLIVEIRKATLLSPREYALVKNTLNGTYRNEIGPQLLKIGAYDTQISVSKKTVLQKDQYTVLKDEKTGAQRVVKGPLAFVPTPSEKSPLGIKKAVFLDTDTAVLVLNRVTGQQRLVTQKGVFFPEADEEILETRELIRVLPHEAMIVRDEKGRQNIYDGSVGDKPSFFLPPYASIFQMMWSDFGAIPKAGEKEQVVVKVPVEKIDLRTRKIFFSYEVPTSDNVKLRLDGTIFWKVSDVSQMMNTTSDPEGDVWHHSRSALIQAVSKFTLQNFMSSFSNITSEAMKMQVADGFYHERGVTLQSMELTKFDTVDASTKEILQQIIQETINRINRLQVQESTNEINSAVLSAQILLERQRTALITTKAENAKLEAEMAGDADGSKVMRAAAAFIGGLNASVPDVDLRVKLYAMHQKLNSKNTDTHNLAAGNAKLFLTPSDINLKSNAADF